MASSPPKKRRHLTCYLPRRYYAQVPNWTSSSAKGILFLDLCWQNDPFPLHVCINHNYSRHQKYETRKAPAGILWSASQSTQRVVDAHVAMLNDTYPSTTTTQFFSSTLAWIDSGTSRKKQNPDVSGFRNIAPSAKAIRMITGSMVQRRSR